jgi:hypothetical protein
MKSVAFAVIASLLAPSMSLAAQGTPNEPWSRIHKWNPGAEVTVQTRNSELRRRYFISVDDDGVTLLNLSDVALPLDVTRVLRQAVGDSPDHFSMAEGVTFKLGERASLSLAGLFVQNQKIAEYDQVVQRVARTDVDAGRSWSPLGSSFLRPA